MLKKYNIAAELICLAKVYSNKGQKKEAAKLLLLAMEENDSEELVDILDEENQDLDPTAEVENEEGLSDEEIEEILKESEDEEVEASEDEEEYEEETETEEELPDVEDVLAKVRIKKQALANLASLSGKTDARRAAIAKFLK